MSVTLSSETQRLIEEKMKQTGVADPDALVRLAFQMLDQSCEVPDELDDETWAALEQADKECDEGKGRPWEEVRAELKARFIDRQQG